MIRKLLTFTTFTLALGTLPAAAHDFVLTSGTDSENQTTVNGLYGHPGSWEAPDIRRLIALDVHTSDETKPSSLLEKVTVSKSSTLKLQAPVAKMEAPDYAAVTAVYDNGFWVSNAEGKYYSTTKKQAAGLITIDKSSRNIKFAKVLLQGEDKATGLRLEIILNKAPSEITAGSKAPVTIIFDGKPLEAAEVAIVPLDGVLNHDTPGTKTNAEGTADLPIEKTGAHVIRVSHDIPSEDPDLADIDGFSATLAFDAGAD